MASTALSIASYADAL